MAPMVVIDASASSILPTLQVFSLVIDDYAQASAEIDWDGIAKAVAQSVRDRAALSGWPTTITTWREAYRKMGFRPSQTASSVEALYRRFRKQDGAWMTKVREVDLYNAFSIQHLAPLGGYDTAKLPPGPITIRAAAPLTDRYVPIGGKVDGSRSPEKVVVYAVGEDVLCWALNQRDSASFGLGVGTKQATFLSEALDDAQSEASQTALHQLAEIAQRHGARCSAIYRHTPLGFVEKHMA